MSNGTISRRTVLRGLGVTMALPWLESMAWANPAQSAVPGNLVKTAAGTFPKRFAVLFKGNVINGLFNQMSVGIGIHPGQTGQLLSGVNIEKGAIVKAGITMDQVLANQIGQDTPQASIVLACEQPMTGYHETNFSMAYSSHISWQSADSPVPNEVYPSLAFDSLFENRGGLRY